VVKEIPNATNLARGSSIFGLYRGLIERQYCKFFATIGLKAEIMPKGGLVPSVSFPSFITFSRLSADFINLTVCTLGPLSE
jgi:hypothetical protein